MNRHELDVMSLLAGLFFTLISLAFLIGATTDLRIDAEWAAPVALIAVGTAGLAGSLASPRAGRETTSRPGSGEGNTEDLDSAVGEDR